MAREICKVCEGKKLLTGEDLYGEYLHKCPVCEGEGYQNNQDWIVGLIMMCFGFFIGVWL